MKIFHRKIIQLMESTELVNPGRVNHRKTVDKITLESQAWSTKQSDRGFKYPVRGQVCKIKLLNRENREKEVCWIVLIKMKQTVTEIQPTPA